MQVRVLTGSVLAALALATPGHAQPRIGAAAPEFTATTFGGRTVRLADLKGEVVILNFWATWCGPCREELPLLERAFRRFGGARLQILAIATEDQIPAYRLRPLVAGLTIPLVKEITGPYRALGALPTNYIIDRSGRLVYARAAAFDLESLDAALLPLLSEPLPAQTSDPRATAALRWRPLARRDRSGASERPIRAAAGLSPPPVGPCPWEPGGGMPDGAKDLDRAPPRRSSVAS